MLWRSGLMDARDLHALAEGPDAEGAVKISVAPPAGGAGARAEGRSEGAASSTNIIAASIEAYIEGLNAMLAEAHWAGAAESASEGKADAHHGRRGELDKTTKEDVPFMG